MEMFVRGKTKEIDGVTWELEGPFCEFCGTHIGMLYDPIGGRWINPNGYEEYGSTKCSGCGMEYQYDEGISPVLTDEEMEVIRKMRIAETK